MPMATSCNDQDMLFIIIRVELLNVFLFPSIFEVEDSHASGRGSEVGG